MLFIAGLVKSIGVSNYTCRHLEELLQYCRFKPTVLQVTYSINQSIIIFCAPKSWQLKCVPAFDTVRVIMHVSVYNQTRHCHEVQVENLSKASCMEGKWKAQWTSLYNFFSSIVNMSSSLSIREKLRD